VPEVRGDGGGQVTNKSDAASSTQPERTPQDYAIEHGGYLADAAEYLLDEINKYDMAESAGEETDCDARSGAWNSLRSAIGEFRKRAARAASRTVEQPEEAGNCPLSEDYVPSKPWPKAGELVSLSEAGYRTVEQPEPEQWADCQRCRQKVLAPHECYESVLNEGEREEFEKWARSRPIPEDVRRTTSGRYLCVSVEAMWDAYRAGSSSRKGK
jgi:hypothetical protein